MLTELNLEGLDPGIREVVKRLRAESFNTTDSGDGVSKVLDMDCALDVPNVHMTFPSDFTPKELYYETVRLMFVVKSWGIKVQPGNIQLTYCPLQESTILSLFNVSDKDLK